MSKQKESAKLAKQAKLKEQNAAIKNFKASSEVENFYRYIADNNLRAEAYILMKTVLEKISPNKRKSKRTLQ